ncbi:MAG TPA: hypothetical protein VFS88_05125 [Micavibrio sp.]|nr:hypothetical protein [Micavibrio sp.]
MRNDFASVAKGMNKEFIFKGYRYRLETGVDARGEVKVIRLDSETLPMALRASIKKECEMISRMLQRGNMLDALIERFSLKPGEAIYPLVIMDSKKAFSGVANNVWGAAMQVLKREYRPENAVTTSKPNPRAFRIVKGALV